MPGEAPEEPGKARRVTPIHHTGDTDDQTKNERSNIPEDTRGTTPGKQALLAVTRQSQMPGPAAEKATAHRNPADPGGPTAPCPRFGLLLTGLIPP